MLEFITARIAAGDVPVLYVRRPMVFGNEVEFRWLRYHNSSVQQLRTAYNVSDDEHDAIMRCVLRHWLRTGHAFALV